MLTPELSAAIDWEIRVGQRLAEAPDPDTARDIVREMWRERSGRHLRSDAIVETVDAAGVPAEWVTTSTARDAVILYVHGGGFTFGEAELERETMARLGAAASARTVAIDYRLAPENPAPAALVDIVTVYTWLLEAGVAPSKIVLVGESPGGGLVSSALVAARDQKLPMPAAAVLWSPFVDFTVSGESIETNASTDPFVNREAAAGAVQAYLQGEDPRAASPLFTDLAGLPPLLVQVGTNEAFFDDARRLVEAANTVGVDATLDPWNDVVHMWHGFPTLPAAIDATERAGAFIAAHTSSAGV